MKKLLRLLFAITAGLCLAVQARAQITKFSYSGLLADNNVPANGTYDFRFTLFSSGNGGSPFGLPLEDDAQIVSAGEFTVLLDFPNAFDGSDRWLEIQVRTNSLNGQFTTLTPRVQISATPYAITAENVSGNVAASQINGAFRTVDGVNGPNLVAGSDNNTVAAGVSGATIAGGGIYGGAANAVNADLGTISGGAGNMIGVNASDATISGGQNNSILSGAAKANIAGGNANQIQAGATYSSIAGGQNNNVNAVKSTIGGGTGNNIQANASNATISGGENNNIKFGAANANIAGGNGNNVQGDATFAAIGGGKSNVVNGIESNIAGGANNAIGANASNANIGGGENNNIKTGAAYANIAGGNANQVMADATYAAIGGGQNNSVNSDQATISGGKANNIADSAPNATISGGQNNDILTGAANANISGGNANQVLAAGSDAAIGGGNNNTVNASKGTISGGANNSIGLNAAGATVAGGVNNDIANGANYANVAGGQNNDIQASANYAFIGGGSDNSAGGVAATVAGGQNNAASAPLAFAAGKQAKAVNNNTFVWSDGNAGSDFTSTAANQFLVHAESGVGINLNNPTEALEVGGNVKATTFIGDGSQLTGVNATVADGSITSTKLATSAVTSANVASGAIDTTKLNDLAVATAKLADSAVTGQKLNDLAVTTAKLGDVSVTTAKLGNGSVTQQKLAAGAPSSGQVLSYNGSALAWTTPAAGSSSWLLSGNDPVSGSFLGTTLGTSIPLELRTKGQRALLLDFNTRSPNLIGGIAGNNVAPGVYGVTIAGGGDIDASGANSVLASLGTIGGGSSHKIGIYSGASTIGGGQNNTIGANNIDSAVLSTIAGGYFNSIASTYSIIAGGDHNVIETGANYSEIAGGSVNRVGSGAGRAVISGGEQNTVAGTLSVIAGGDYNSVTSAEAVIGGGVRNTNAAQWGVIGGGNLNSIQAVAKYSTIPGGLGATTRSYGQMAHASGTFTTPGDAQASQYVLRNTTSTGAEAELTADPFSGGARMKMPVNGVWVFDIQIVASGTNQTTHLLQFAGYTIKGVVSCAANGVTSLHPSSIAPTVLYEDDPAWDVRVAGDGGGGSSLQLYATGAAGVAINWVASVRTVEVIK